jgi:uncharacterized Ntn-hydrolase superfamily protein
MTFSLAVREGESFASLISSSSPAVGARCVHLRDGVGVVHSQNITDPRLGGRILDLLEGGASAADAVDRVVSTDATAPFRQLVAVDAQGRTAIHSGPNALGIVGEYRAQDAAAAGNMLASDGIPRILVEAWQTSSGNMETRLLAAFTAAMDAGGEAGPVHSAAITVVTGNGWRTTDLRVDWDDDPLARMRDLVATWLPQRDDYLVRALDPANSPGYGVAGDDR